jgi:hypothetical protein
VVISADELYAIAFFYCSEIPAKAHEVFGDKMENATIHKQLLQHIGIVDYTKHYTQEELLDIVKEQYREQIGAAISEMLMASS